MVSVIMKRDITNIPVTASMISQDPNGWDLDNVTNVFSSITMWAMKCYRYRRSNINEVMIAVVCPVTRGSPLFIRNKLQVYTDVCYKSRIRLDERVLSVDLNTYRG
jgi:hypothetical protein